MQTLTESQQTIYKVISMYGKEGIPYHELVILLAGNQINAGGNFRTYMPLAAPDGNVYRMDKLDFGIAFNELLLLKLIEKTYISNEHAYPHFRIVEPVELVRRKLERAKCNSTTNS